MDNRFLNSTDSQDYDQLEGQPKKPTKIMTSENQQENDDHQLQYLQFKAKVIPVINKIQEFLEIEKRFRSKIMILVCFVNAVFEKNPTNATNAQLNELNRLIAPYREISLGYHTIKKAKNIHETYKQMTTNTELMALINIFLNDNIKNSLKEIIEYAESKKTWEDLVEADQCYFELCKLLSEINTNPSNSHQSFLDTSYRKTFGASLSDHLILPVQRHMQYSLFFRDLEKVVAEAKLPGTINETIKNTSDNVQRQSKAIDSSGKQKIEKPNAGKVLKSAAEPKSTLSGCVAKGCKNVLFNRVEEKQLDGGKQENEFLWAVHQQLINAVGEDEANLLKKPQDTLPTIQFKLN